MPQPQRSVVAIAPPALGAGVWAGAPSAVLAGGEIFLAYRVRRPVGQGRGYAINVARSADGVRFENILSIGKDQLSTESLERPALVRTPDGRWRLYLSCATPGTMHWRVEVVEADHPGAFDPRRSRVVLPGDAGRAVKDPVIVHDGERWHLWASIHELADPAESDRMRSAYATSADGLRWTWHGTALSPRPGEWDARGTRIAAVRLLPGRVVAYYDGRAAAAENYEERTGLAEGSEPWALTARGPIAQSPYGRGGLRYVSIVDLGVAGERYYYEMARADGAHELRTELRRADAA